MKRWLILLLVLLPLAFALPADAGSVCREDPLSVYGPAASNRYVLIDPCRTVSGPVAMFAEETPEQGGEKHIYLWTEVGNGDGQVDVEFAEPELLPEIEDLFRLVGLGQATATGALVFDRTRGRYSIKPAWALHELARHYPERRADGSVWLVQQWADGHYTDRLVN